MTKRRSPKKWFHKACQNNSLYNKWQNMILRCHDPVHPMYRNYGARGIVVCPEWIDDWDAFAEWAFTSNYQDGMTIDRKDNEANYSPKNCRWVSRIENTRNRRNTIMVTIGTRTQALSAWAEEMGVKYGTLYARHGCNRHPAVQHASVMGW